jgi:hypothetical protein
MYQRCINIRTTKTSFADQIFKKQLDKLELRKSQIMKKDFSINNSNTFNDIFDTNNE